MLLLLALLLQSSVKLEISAPKTVFFLGETIPLRLSFTSTQPNTFVVSGDAVASISRISQIDQFIVNPVADAEDPMQGLPGQSGGIGTLHSAPAVLSETPFVSEKILNEWVPLPQARHLSGTCLEPAGAKGRRARSSDGSRFQCADP